MDPSESDPGPRFTGIGLTAVALLLGGAVIAGGPSSIPFFRPITAAAMGGLLAIGLLVAVTGQDRPLTPSRAALVPLGVTLGLGALVAGDALRFAAGASGVGWNRLYTVLVLSGFGAPVGSALAGGRYGPGVLGFAVVVLADEAAQFSLAGTGTPRSLPTSVAWSVAFAAPAAYVGYAYTARDPTGGRGSAGSVDAAP